MNRTLLIATLLGSVALSACDRQPVVVNTPAPVVVPGPAGPAGPAGATGDSGTPGATGKTGESTTVVVMPPPAASAPN